MADDIVVLRVEDSFQRFLLRICTWPQRGWDAGRLCIATAVVNVVVPVLARLVPHEVECFQIPQPSESFEDRAELIQWLEGKHPTTMAIEVPPTQPEAQRVYSGPSPRRERFEEA